MKALSFTPPWPNAILHLGKRIENRQWRGCSYRGPILLHAAKGIGTRDDFDEGVETILRIERAQSGSSFEHVVRSLGVVDDAANWWRPGLSTLRGGICGRARIVDVIDPMPARSGPPDQSWEAWVSRGGDPDQRRWWFGGFALVLDDVEPLPFRPWPGALGLFEVPDSEVPR